MIAFSNLKLHVADSIELEGRITPPYEDFEAAPLDELVLDYIDVSIWLIDWRYRYGGEDTYESIYAGDMRAALSVHIQRRIKRGSGAESSNGTELWQP